MGYAPVNNTLVIKSNDTDKLASIFTDEEIWRKLNAVLSDDVTLYNKTDNSISELWYYYETNGEPYEEIPEFIKQKYPDVRVFFSSIDYDEFCFAYYKEIGVDVEYDYYTGNEELCDDIFEKFIRK